MNFKTTLILLALLALAAALVLLLQQPTGKGTATSAARGAGEPVFVQDAFTADDVDQLEVSLADGRSATFAREDDGWWQTQPSRFAVIEPDLRGALNAAANLRWVEHFQPGTSDEANAQTPSPHRLSLDPPRATVRLRVTRDGQPAVTHVIRLGRGVGGRLYVQVDDRPRVYVVGNDLAARLLDDRSTQPLLADWRRRTLDGPDAAAVRRVVIRSGSQITELLREDGRWTFAAPHEDRVDGDAARRLLATLVSLNVSRFVDDAPADRAVYGLQEPTVEIVAVSNVVESDDAAPGDVSAAVSQPTTLPAAHEPTARTMRLSIGGRVDLEGQSYYAALTDHAHDGRAVFTLARSIVESLRVSVDDLRDPRLTPTTAADITGVHVARRDQDEFTLTRQVDGWRLDQTPDMPIAPAAVSELLDALTQTRAVGYQTPDALGPAPRATVQIAAIGRDADAVETLRLYEVPAAPETSETTSEPEETTAPGKAMLVVVRDNERVGRRMPASALAPLFDPIDVLQARMLIERDGDSLQTLNIAGPDLTLSWTRPAPSAPEAATQPSPVVPQALIDALLPLRAQRWLARVDALPADALTIDMVFTDGTANRLRVDPTSGQARLDDQAMHFAISPALHDALLDAMRQATGQPAPAK